VMTDAANIKAPRLKENASGSLPQVQMQRERRWHREKRRRSSKRITEGLRTSSSIWNH
jgi:hypothetical protein